MDRDQQRTRDWILAKLDELATEFIARAERTGWTPSAEELRRALNDGTVEITELGRVFSGHVRDRMALPPGPSQVFVELVEANEQDTPPRPAPDASLIQRAALAADVIVRYGHIEGDHHKAWVFDQVMRLLLGPDYDRFATWVVGDDPDARWDEGIAP